MPATKRLFSDSLTLARLTGARGGRVLFHNFSLTIAAGQAVRLTGDNGTGKSSLLRMVAGVLPVMEGSVSFGNKNPAVCDRLDYANLYAFLPADDRDLKLLETGVENLAFWAALWKIENPAAAAAAALQAMGLQSLAQVALRYYSAGQKRRLSLARVLLKQSPLWLLDEPFNALDTKSADLLTVVLQNHLAQGGVALLAAHQAPVLENVSVVELGAKGGGA